MPDANAEIETLRKLLDQGWRSDLADRLASHLTNRGGVYSNRGQFREAIEDLDQAVALFTRLLREDGLRPLEYKLALAFTNAKLGSMAQGVEDLEEAMVLFRKLVEQDGRRELADALAMVTRNHTTATQHMKGGPVQTPLPRYDPQAVQPLRDEPKKVGFRELIFPLILTQFSGRVEAGEYRTHAEAKRDPIRGEGDVPGNEQVQAGTPQGVKPLPAGGDRRGACPGHCEVQS